MTGPLLPLSTEPTAFPVRRSSSVPRLGAYPTLGTQPLNLETLNHSLPAAHTLQARSLVPNGLAVSGGALQAAMLGETPGGVLTGYGARRPISAVETATLASPLLNVLAQPDAHGINQKLPENEESAKFDPFLQYPLRLGGFFNETEAVTQGLIHPDTLFSKLWTPFAWGTTIAYVGANCIARGLDAYRDAYQETGDEITGEMHGLKEGLIALVYQSLASLFGPIFAAIHPAQHAVEHLFHRAKGREIVNKADSVEALTKFIQSDLAHFGLDAEPNPLEAAAHLAKRLKAHPPQQTNILSELGPALSAVKNNLLAEGADDLLPVFEKLGKRQFQALFTKKTFYQGALKSPVLQLGLLKALVGFGAVGVWLVTADKWLDSFREKVILPVADHIVNHYLHERGNTQFWPEEDKRAQAKGHAQPNESEEEALKPRSHERPIKPSQAVQDSLLQERPAVTWSAPHTAALPTPGASTISQAAFHSSPSRTPGAAAPSPFQLQRPLPGQAAPLQPVNASAQPHYAVNWTA